jgi:hypothetical protein
MLHTQETAHFDYYYHYKNNTAKTKELAKNNIKIRK